MRVALDTNIFHGHWQLGGASFAYLFHYLNNEQCQLFLPEVVRRETNNLQARELEAAITAVKSHLNSAAGLNGLAVVQQPLAFVAATYDIAGLLEAKVDNLAVIGYDQVIQSEVLERALSKRRPFQDDGTGYRDTMIWLSLLAHLADDGSTEPIAFITKNRRDFFDLRVKDGTVFHPHLLEDIRRAGISVEVIPFDSLDAFVKSKIDKHAHALDHNRIEDLIGSEVVDEAVRFLESASDVVVASLSRRFTPRTGAFARASKVTVDIIEGIEDFSVLSTADLGNGNIHIRVDFDLRIVAVGIAIPAAEYGRLEAEASESAALFDVHMQNGEAVVDVIVRPRFEASVVYNRDTSEVSAFEVAKLRLK